MRFACLLFLSTVSAWGDGPKIGAPAPPLNLAQLMQAPEGADATWEKLRGRVVVLEFWSTGCGPCVKAFPHWNEIVAQCKDKPITFIAVDDENPAVVKAFLKRQPISSWIGFEGISQSTRDRYGITGIPTAVIVNQEGVVVAATHPMNLEVKHLQEVVDTKQSSLPPPPEEKTDSDTGAVVNVKQMPALFEVSIRRSGPRPAGHGFNCWSASPNDITDIKGEYASLASIIENAYGIHPLCLRLPANMPEGDFDFKLRAQTKNQADVDQLFGIALRQTFGLTARRVMQEQSVYVLTMGSSNAPGLQLFDPTAKRSGGQVGGGKVKLEHVTVGDLGKVIADLMGTMVIDESGSTNLYTARMQWKMSPAELMGGQFSPAIWRALEAEKDSSAWNNLKDSEKEIVSATKGTLAEEKLKSLSPEVQENIRVVRIEMAKPSEKRFSPDPELIRQSVEEQFGLKLTPAKRSMEVIVVERIVEPKVALGQ